MDKEWEVEATIKIKTSFCCDTIEEASRIAHEYLSEMCQDLYPDGYEVENLYIKQKGKGKDKQGMKTMLKPSYSAMRFKAEGMLECGEIYVCDNLQDVVIRVIIKDATNDIESRINILKNIVMDYINKQEVRMNNESI